MVASYATADVDSSGSVSGLIGLADGGSVDQAFAAGSLSGSGTTDRGDLYYSHNLSPSATALFWGVPATDTDLGYWTGIGSLSDTSPADGLVGETLHGDVESGFDFADTWETVSADDPDADEDGYPVLQASDRETQLEVRG